MALQLKYVSLVQGGRDFRLINVGLVLSAPTPNNTPPLYSAATAPVSKIPLYLNEDGRPEEFLPLDTIPLGNLPPVLLRGHTVSSLPTGTVGMMAYCTDLLSPAYLAAATGGGSVVGPVFYNGTTWVSC